MNLWTYLTINFNLICYVNNILNNLYHSEYSKCPSLARMQARRRLLYWSVNRLWRSVPLQPTHQSDAASNHSHPPLSSCRLVAEVYARFCSQLDWGHGCSAATKLAWWLHGGTWLHLALAHGISADTSDNRGVWRALQRTGIGPSVSISGVFSSGFVSMTSLLGWVSSSRPQPRFLQCVRTSTCHCHGFGRCFVFLQLTHYLHIANTPSLLFVHSNFTL